MNQADIRTVDAVSDADVQAIRALVAQLSADADQFSRSDLQEMLADPGTTIFPARLEGRIIGITTLIAFRVATGRRAFIDDVVVLEDFRGRQIGEQLVGFAVQHARSRNVGVIDLTSRPAREAANRLYQRPGFQRRETNVYRLAVWQ